MPKSIENNKVSITIATVAICILFIFTLAFNLGAEQAKIVDSVNTIEKKQELTESRCAAKWQEQDSLNKELLEAVIIIKNDVKHIIKVQDQETKKKG